MTPELKTLRQVRPPRPGDSADPLTLATWREGMVTVLYALSRHLIYEEARAAAETAEARKQAIRIRATVDHELRREHSGSGTAQDPTSSEVCQRRGWKPNTAS